MPTKTLNATPDPTQVAARVYVYAMTEDYTIWGYSPGNLIVYNKKTKQGFSGLIMETVENTAASGVAIPSGKVWAQGNLLTYDAGMNVTGQVLASCELDLNGPNEAQSIGFEVTAGDLGVPGPVLESGTVEPETWGGFFLW